jgi:hypothetical protein
MIRTAIIFGIGIITAIIGGFMQNDTLITIGIIALFCSYLSHLSVLIHR